jgi:hypothetical protein
MARPGSPPSSRLISASAALVDAPRIAGQRRYLSLATRDSVVAPPHSGARDRLAPPSGGPPTWGLFPAGLAVDRADLAPISGGVGVGRRSFAAEYPGGVGRRFLRRRMVRMRMWCARADRIADRMVRLRTACAFARFRTAKSERVLTWCTCGRFATIRGTRRTPRASSVLQGLRRST